MCNWICADKKEDNIMNSKQLRIELVRPVLNFLGLWSKDAEDLIMGTIYQESGCGEYLRQIGCSGDIGAFGICQMELATHKDIWENFLKYNSKLADKVLSLKILSLTDAENLKWNLAYDVAMARIHYYRIKEAIPSGTHAQAQYWKRFYNTINGAGTVEEYLTNWNKYNK